MNATLHMLANKIQYSNDDVYDKISGPVEHFKRHVLSQQVT